MKEMCNSNKTFKNSSAGKHIIILDPLTESTPEKTRHDTRGERGHVSVETPVKQEKFRGME
jgi:hypothetical protein